MGSWDCKRFGKVVSGEIREMLHDSALRIVKNSCEAEAQDHSKLH